MFKQLLLVTTLLMMPTLGFAWQQQPNKPPEACAAQIPYGMPTILPDTVDASADRRTIECHTAYILAYDNVSKIPTWVSYTLTPDHAIGCLARSNAFTADQIIPPYEQSTPKDYEKSGYDKGHLANDADMSWDPQVQNESFLMTNMSPQTPEVNRGIWKVLETSVRAWVIERNQPYTIYAGNIWGAKSATIGANKVVVPDYLYKIVINDATKEYAAWIFPNISKKDLGDDLLVYRTTVEVVKNNTGIVFPFPVDGKELPVQETWPVNIGTLTKLKHQECKLSH